MFGSVLLLVLLLGGLGQWTALVPLAWLASAVAVPTLVGERIAARVACGFRRPSAAQVTALAPLWAAALLHTGTAAGDVDLYVQRCPRPNAYAAGSRMVAVTTGILGTYLARRLTDEQLVAVLVHELGHHESGTTRASLVSTWLAAPWRLATRLVLCAAHAVAGRRPRTLLAAGACLGVVVAVAQALSQRNWIVAGLLAGVATLSVTCPVTDDALARREELAADRFAADHGLAQPLAGALRILQGDHRSSTTGLQLRRGNKVIMGSPAAVDRCGAARRMMPCRAQTFGTGRPSWRS